MFEVGDRVTVYGSGTLEVVCVWADRCILSDGLHIHSNAIRLVTSVPCARMSCTEPSHCRDCRMCRTHCTCKGGE